VNTGRQPSHTTHHLSIYCTKHAQVDRIAETKDSESSFGHPFILISTKGGVSKEMPPASWSLTEITLAADKQQ